MQQTTELYCDAGHRALYCIHHCARDWAQVSGTRVKDFHSKFFIDPTTGTCFCVEVYPNSNSCSYTLALILYNGVMTPACEPVPTIHGKKTCLLNSSKKKCFFSEVHYRYYNGLDILLIIYLKKTCIIAENKISLERKHFIKLKLYPEIISIK